VGTVAEKVYLKCGNKTFLATASPLTLKAFKVGV